MADPATQDEFHDPAPPESMKARNDIEDTEMDITPMIDITFLLLIFFIVASKMEEGANVPLPPAKNGVAMVMKECIVITVGEGSTDDTVAVYAADGDSAESLIDSSDVTAMQTALQEYVEEQLALDSRKTTIMIKGAAGVKHKHISTVAKAAARAAEITQMAWAVMETQ